MVATYITILYHKIARKIWKNDKNRDEIQIPSELRMQSAYTFWLKLMLNPNKSEKHNRNAREKFNKMKSNYSVNCALVHRVREWDKFWEIETGVCVCLCLSEEGRGEWVWVNCIMVVLSGSHTITGRLVEFIGLDMRFCCWFPSQSNF